MIKRIAAGVVLVLAALVLTACAKSTVTGNTNPSGNPNVECWITWVEDETGKEHKTQHSAQTCKLCPVGAEWPKCYKNERSDTPPRGATTPVTNRTAIGGEAIVLTVTLLATKPYVSASMHITNADGRVGDLVTMVSGNALSVSKRIPATTTDKEITITAEGRTRDVVLDVKVEVARREIGKCHGEGGRLSCAVKIAGKV